MAIFGSDKGARKAADLQKDIMTRWESLELPTADELYNEIPEFGAPVQYDPLTGRALDYQDSLLNNLNPNQEVLQNQMDAMDSFNEIVQAGGLTDMDKAALYDIINQQETAGRGARDALTQEFDQRMGGVANSGLEGVLKAIANQGAATTGAQQGMDIAAIAQARKLDAADSLGRLSGDVRNQDFSEDSKVALAQDLINQFNTQNRQRVEELNQSLENEGQMYNVGQEQRINDMNTVVSQEQAAMDANIQREMLANNVAKLTGVAGAAGGVANAEVARDTAKNAVMGNILSTVGTVGGAIVGGPMGAAAGGAVGRMAGGGGGAPAADYSFTQVPAQAGAELFKPKEGSFFSDVRLKEDIQDGAPDAEEILRGLSPYKYQFRDKEMGEGDQLGPMAQELEQTAPGMVEDTEHGKKVNFDLGTITALLGHMNDKINSMGGDQ